MTRLSRLAAIAAIAAAVPLHANAVDRRFPDWPCVQARVGEISVATAWTGPSVEDALDIWDDDRQIADLVAHLAARRTPLDEAEKAAVEFVQNGNGDKQEKAKLLVAGLFDTLNRERLDVVNGLERLTRRQRDFATSIEADAARLRNLQSKPDADQKEVADLANRVEWATRIFEERRKSVRFACEVPVVIEQRFFALARAVQRVLD
ncbi:hypothetical protein [Flaviflagellibacter deserti]|uniref:Uncharacterized protein n=1 Tax=Flaviflagellibacter deserti TaxID=2267266 RepID=A0ABV9Z2R7_9HYPH